VIASLRSRADATILRWQGRLDDDAADRMLPWIIATVLALVLALLALARHRSLDADPSLAAGVQATFLIAEGSAPEVTVGGGGNALADQLSLVLYPLAVVTRVLPSATALLVVQAIALALTVVPLWRFGRAHAGLRVGAVATLAFVFALYPAIHAVNLGGFHAAVFALPALVWAMHLGMAKRILPFALAIAVVLATRSDLGLAVAGVGIVLALTGQRSLGWRTALVGVGWAAVATVVIQPLVGGGLASHADSFARFGDAPASIVWGMVSQPGEVVGALVRERNFELFVVLFGPLLFLPVLAPRFLVGLLPLQVLYLLADTPNAELFGPQAVAATAFLFLSTAVALHRLGRQGVERVVVDPRILVALLLAGSVFFIREAAASPYQQPWDWGGQDVTDAARRRAAGVIPADATVVASSEVAVLLAERLQLELWDPDAEPVPADDSTAMTYVIVDEAIAEGWTSADRRVYERRLEALGFTSVLVDGEISVWSATP
jgi:uncharacterized membrane protein